MSGVLGWEDPPQVTGRSLGRYGVGLAHELIASQLRRRPADWALIAENPGDPSIPGSIIRGKLAAYRPAGHFEAVHRSVDGVYRVYARYVGEATDE